MNVFLHIDVEVDVENEDGPTVVKEDGLETKMDHEVDIP